MEESVGKRLEIITRLQQELGPNWNVTSKNIFDCVYYFDCEFEGRHFLTHSYGIYKETDTGRIIKTEVEQIKRLL